MVNIKTSKIIHAAPGAFSSKVFYYFHFAHPFSFTVSRPTIFIPVISLTFWCAEPCFAWFTAPLAFARIRPSVGKIAFLATIFSSAVFYSIRVHHDLFATMLAGNFYWMVSHIVSIPKYINSYKPKYFDIACRRIADAYKQPRLFEDPKPEYKQEDLL